MVADVVLPPEKAGAYNRMERLRDPSHPLVLSYPEMAEIIGASGLTNLQTGRLGRDGVGKAAERLVSNPGDANRIRRLFEAEFRG